MGCLREESSDDLQRHSKCLCQVDLADPPGLRQRPASFKANTHGGIYAVNSKERGSLLLLSVSVNAADDALLVAAVIALLLLLLLLLV